MRQRDTTVESSRRSARQSQIRLESSLDANEERAKLPQKDVAAALTEPLPELIMKNPEYRQLYDDNRRLYVVVAEQQLTLEMIMEKYRAKVAESTNMTKNIHITQECLNRHDGILGMKIHCRPSDPCGSFDHIVP